MSPRTGRPRKADAKDVSLQLRIRKDTDEKLKKCAERMQTSRTVVVERGIDLVEKELDNK